MATAIGFQGDLSSQSWVGNDEIIEFLLSLAKREIELEDVEEWLMKSVKSK